MSVPYKQELPPVGGYEPIKFKRNLPVKGPSGAVLFGGTFLLCSWGFYRYAQGNKELKELKREDIWSRIHLVPFLTAESDRDRYRREQANLEREKQIMEDVPGWEAGKSVYNSKKYVPKTIVPM